MDSGYEHKKTCHDRANRRNNGDDENKEMYIYTRDGPVAPDNSSNQQGCFKNMIDLLKNTIKCEELLKQNMNGVIMKKALISTNGYCRGRINYKSAESRNCG
jgi:hypothetical protein